MASTISLKFWLKLCLPLRLESVDSKHYRWDVYYIGLFERLLWEHSILWTHSRALLTRVPLQEKRLKQKELADDIAVASKLSRPKTPPDTTTSILSTALPMNRPSQNNWAFQTIYLPKTMSNWHPGNVTKVHQVRKSPGHFDDIDYATAAKLFTRATVITPWV